jgi:hypothetical protein
MQTTLALQMSQFLNLIRFRGATGLVATFNAHTGLYDFKHIADVDNGDLVVVGLNPMTKHITLATVYCNISVECGPTQLYEVFTRENNSTEPLTLLSDNANYAEAMVEKIIPAESSEFTEPYLSITKINNLYFETIPEKVLTTKRIQELRDISQVGNTIIAGERYEPTSNKVICASSFLLWQLPLDAPLTNRNFLSPDIGKYIQVVSLNPHLYNDPFWTNNDNIKQLWNTWLRYPSYKCILREGECQVITNNDGNIATIELIKF